MLRTEGMNGEGVKKCVVLAQNIGTFFDTA
jgi:hypothetical protein